jgi:uncharacterized protein
MPAGGEALSDPFRDGIRLFNEEYFFEAHEHLEGLWHLERGEPRQFLQGLIQICAAFHHFQNGNLIGAVDLLKRGPDKMRRYPGRFLGIDAATLIAKVDEARERIERMRTGKEPMGRVEFPKIELPGDGG